MNKRGRLNTIYGIQIMSGLPTLGDVIGKHCSHYDQYYIETSDLLIKSLKNTEKKIFSV